VQISINKQKRKIEKQTTKRQTTNNKETNNKGTKRDYETSMNENIYYANFLFQTCETQLFLTNSKIIAF